MVEEVQKFELEVEEEEKIEKIDEEFNIEEDFDEPPKLPSPS